MATINRLISQIDDQSMTSVFEIIRRPSISNVNLLIEIDCYRLSSVLDYIHVEDIIDAKWRSNRSWSNEMILSLVKSNSKIIWLLSNEFNFKHLYHLIVMPQRSFGNWCADDKIVWCYAVRSKTTPKKETLDFRLPSVVHESLCLSSDDNLWVKAELGYRRLASDASLGCLWVTEFKRKRLSFVAA